MQEPTQAPAFVVTAADLPDLFDLREQTMQAVNVGIKDGNGATAAALLSAPAALKAPLAVPPFTSDYRGKREAMVMQLIEWIMDRDDAAMADLPAALAVLRAPLAAVLEHDLAFFDFGAAVDVGDRLDLYEEVTQAAYAAWKAAFEACPKASAFTA